MSSHKEAGNREVRKPKSSKAVKGLPEKGADIAKDVKSATPSKTEMTAKQKDR
jgi:hypothetical protein